MQKPKLKFSKAFGPFAATGGDRILEWKIEGDLPLLGEALDGLRTASPRTTLIRTGERDFWSGKSNFHGFKEDVTG